MLGTIYKGEVYIMRDYIYYLVSIFITTLILYLLLISPFYNKTKVDAVAIATFLKINSIYVRYGQKSSVPYPSILSKISVQ